MMHFWLSALLVILLFHSGWHGSWAATHKPRCDVLAKPVSVRVHDVGHGFLHNITQRESFDGSTAQGILAYEAYRGGLVAQNAMPMSLRELVIDGGQICAAASGAWILKALLTQLEMGSQLPAHPADLAATVVHTAYYNGFDVRYGSTLPFIARALTDVASSHGVQLLSAYAGPVTNPKLLRLRPNTLALLSLTDPSSEQEANHAVILLNANPQTQTINWIDPNSPSVVYRSKYTARVVRGKPFVELTVPSPTKAVIAEIVYFRAEPRQTESPPLSFQQKLVQNIKATAQAVLSLDLEYRLRRFILPN